MGGMVWRREARNARREAEAEAEEREVWREGCLTWYGMALPLVLAMIVALSCAMVVPGPTDLTTIAGPVAWPRCTARTRTCARRQRGATRMRDG